MFLSKPLRYCAWFRSRWFLLSLSSVVALSIVMGFATGAPATYLVGQITLGLSVFISLFLLSDRPLINPIQSVVLVFYWWFGVGPTVIASWNYMIGMPDAALAAQVSGMEALYIVAPGLLFYALVARLTLLLFSKARIGFRFLIPTDDNYRTKVLVVYLLLSLSSAGLLLILHNMGIEGQENTTFLGGVKTTIWWVGVIAAVGSITPFIVSAAVTALAAPWKTIPFVLKIVIVVTILQTFMSAILSGWKGPIAYLIVYYACAYVSRHQRPPWMFLMIGMSVFIVFVVPYVTYGRYVTQVSGTADPLIRKQIFSELLNDPQAFLPNDMSDINPTVLFRGIYPLAGELTRRNSMFAGEWQGETISWGLSLLVPRVFNPDKRDSNIGVFFSQALGLSTGDTNSYSDLNNASISLPFEFVGNYGWGAGVLAFSVIGIFWSLLCYLMLSPARLSNHPLSPFMALSALGLEGSTGSFLGGLRGLIIPLILCFFVYKALREKI